MTNVYPTVLLKNEATGRYHPMIYRIAPMPGGATLPGAQRYKSAGHHTEGFESKDGAMEWIQNAKDRGVVWTGRELHWDGKDVPASVDFFQDAELRQSTTGETT